MVLPVSVCGTRFTIGGGVTEEEDSGFSLGLLALFSCDWPLRVVTNAAFLFLKISRDMLLLHSGK